MEVPDALRSRSPARQSESRHSLQDLCSTCSKVDFEAIIADPTQIGDRHTSIEVDSERYACGNRIHGYKALRPGCLLCQMFLKLSLGQLFRAEKRDGVPQLSILLRSTNRNRPWNGLTPLPI